MAIGGIAVELFTRIGAAILLIVGGGLWFFAPTTDRLTAHSEVAPHLLSDNSPNRSVPKIDLLATHGLDGIVAYAETQTQLPKPTPAKGPSCEVLDPDQGFVDEMLVRFAEDSSKSYERRVALVIGNGAYEGAIGKLDNPANDATSMANVMSALGFTVYRGIDLDADGLETCLDRFTAELQSEPTDIALFFYAGHGIQLVSNKDNEKRNYMMATDASIDWWGRGTGYKQIDTVLNQMRDHSEQSVFFYDACRDYPLGNQRPASIDGISIKRGIAMVSGPAAMSLKQQEADDRAGIYIAYATAPNRVADDAYERGANHSPFTRALLNNIAAPGFSLKRSMSYVSNDVGELTDWNQTPWTSSSLTEDLFLSGTVLSDELSIRSSKFAERSNLKAENGEYNQAVAFALKGLPKRWSKDHLTSNFGSAMAALYRTQSSLKTGQLKHGNFGALLNDVAYNNNGSLIASAAGDVRIWNATSGALMHNIKPACTRITSDMFDDSCDIKSIAFGGPKLIALGLGNGKTLVYEWSTGRLVSQFVGSGSVSKVEFSLDGRRLLILESFRVSIWDITTGARIVRLGHNFLRGRGTLGAKEKFLFGVVGVAAISPDGQSFAAMTSGTKKIFVFDIQKHAAIQEITAVESLFSMNRPSLSFTPDSKSIAFSQTTFTIWDIHTGKERVRFELGNENPNSISFSADGRAVAAGTNTGFIVWDSYTGKKLHQHKEINRGEKREITNIGLSPNGQHIVGRFLNDIFLWQMPPGAMLKSRQLWFYRNVGKRQNTTIFDELDISDSGDYLGASFWGAPEKNYRPDGSKVWFESRIWHYPSLNLIYKARFNSKTISAEGLVFVHERNFTVLPGANSFFSYGHRGEIATIRSTKTGQIIQSFKHCGDGITYDNNNCTVTDAIISNDSRLVATGGVDGLVKLWDAATGSVLQTFEGQGCHERSNPDDRKSHCAKPAYQLDSLSFSLDGKLVAMETAQNSVSLYDTSDGNLILQIETEAGLRRPTLHPDGTRVTTEGFGTQSGGSKF